MESVEGFSHMVPGHLVFGNVPQWTPTAPLLSTSGEVGGFVVGDQVRVREDIEPQYRLADVEGEVGEVIAIEDDELRVCFPSSDRWRGLASELLLATDNLQVGLKVRVRKGVRPSYGWGNAAPGQIGEVVQLQRILVIVRFPEAPQWHGKRSEVELVETEGAGRPGGYEATWADPAAAEEYECPICKQVCKDAVMHKCCCIFCEGCWNECHKHDARCPMCRQNPKYPAFPAYQVRKDIGKLQLRCPRGCGATFLLLQNDSLLQHLEECSFKPDASNLALQATQTEQTELDAQTELSRIFK